MTHGEMRGEVVGYLANPDALPPGLIDQSLYLGAMALYRRMKAHMHFRSVREKTLPLEENRDLYEPGEEVADILRVTRMDSGGEWRVTPLDPRQLSTADDFSIDEGPRYSYTPAPDGRIRLLEKPTATTTPERGLRITFRGKPVRLRARDQVPDFPEPTHEAIVVRAVERLILKGIPLGAAARFEEFRKRVDAELDSYLVPSFEDGRGPEAVDSLGLYGEEDW